jgi:hypothetical protein
MNSLEKLRGKEVHLKLNTLEKPVAAKVINLETSGLWIEGSPILQAVVGAGAKGFQSSIVFVPFQNVEWLVAEKEPGL